MAKTRRCYGCRVEFKDTGNIFCEDCNDDPQARKGGSVLVIYDKV